MRAEWVYYHIDVPVSGHPGKPGVPERMRSGGRELTAEAKPDSEVWSFFHAPRRYHLLALAARQAEMNALLEPPGLVTPQGPRGRAS